MNIIRSFQFRRHHDDLIYYFDEVGTDRNGRVFKRRDLDVLVVRNHDHGWVAVADEKISATPWLVPLKEQEDYPPEGDWISRKHEKVYVYSLSYVS